jgi:hypothetical protein
MFFVTVPYVRATLISVYFVGKNAKDVMGHVKWYEQYNSLVRGNQEQLQKWDAEKRQDRQMIYQMATEGQRSKLDDEKRRQERLKNNREEEKLRGRNSLSRWKVRTHSYSAWLYFHHIFIC